MDRICAGGKELGIECSQERGGSDLIKGDNMASELGEGRRT